ncbi:MAG: hypothetical protein B7Y44_07895 [Sphingomonadales bacterium 28-55-16]|nr:MAG: hypothetical protein B7Y44_07895 [Sphingomonadales bacterium 28-55-16]
MKIMSVLRASVACIAISIITPAAAEIAVNKVAGGDDVVRRENYAGKTIMSLPKNPDVSGVVRARF